jgi:tight adherence protein B
MPQSITANHFLILLVLVFIAMLLFFEGAYMFWRAYHGPLVQKLQKRLEGVSATTRAKQPVRVLKERMLSELPLIQRRLLNLPRARWLERYILQAGAGWTVSKLLLVCAVLAVVGWAVMAIGFHQPAWLAGLLGAALAALPLLYVQRERRRRLARIEQQLPEALDLMTRALRSGHAFSSAVKMVGEEMTEPLAGEFRTVHDEVNYGVSLQQALTNMSERVPLTDLRYFVVAVLIQRDSGGNLTEVLGNLGRVIRERLKLMSRVRVPSS